MPGRKAPDLTDHKWEHVGSQELSKALQVGHPWLLWLGLPVLGAILHGLWPVWWAALLVGAGCTGLALGSMYLTHNRSGWHGRLMAPVSFALMGAWLTWVDQAGLVRPNSPEVGLWFIGGGMGAFYWSHWLHARGLEEHGSIGHRLVKAFATIGHPSTKVIQLKPLAEDEGEGHTGVIEHPTGMTADEFAKAIPNATAAAGLPPGSITTSPDMTHGGRSLVSVSNPLLLTGIQPWPGPSAPGASIVDPIIPGRYSSGRPVKLVVVNHNTQVMGMTGAGKSFGWLWNEFGEQWTRPDAATMGADITKGEQTLGPMRMGLHRAEVTRDGVADMLMGVHRAVRARTDYLAFHGYNRYFKGCKLRHLTIGLEEAPDIIDLLDDAELVALWLSDVKAGRSGGIRWLISLQRSTFDQMPTIVRSQLSKVCFGVESSDDADYGLSDRQKKRNCHPGDWQANYPGKFYLDAPGITDSLVAEEARSWAWGDSDKDGGKAGADLMRAHAAAYPASSRPLDDITMEAMSAPPRSPSAAPPGPRPAPAPQEDEVPKSIDPEDPSYRLDDDLENAGSGPAVDTDAMAGDWVFTDDPGEPGEPMTPEQAMDVLDRKLAELREAARTTFGLDEMAAVLEETGRSPAWLYDVLARKEAEGQIRRRATRPRTWQLGQAA